MKPPQREIEVLLWRIPELAAALNISVRSAFTRIKAGDVPGVLKLGRMTRIRIETIMAWLSDGGPPVKEWEARRREARNGPNGQK